MAGYYLVPFTCDCEVCGKPFKGVFFRNVPSNEDAFLSGALTSGMINAADYADARLTKRHLDSRIKEHRWTELGGGGVMTGVSYGEARGHACPNCGARQSWDPMDPPKEPEKTSGKVGYMVISAIICGIIGMLVGLFAMVIADSEIALIGCAAIGVVGGAAAGYSMAGSINKEEASNYDERLAAYQRDKAAYEAYQASLATRAAKNEPVADCEAGYFDADIPATMGL